MAMKLSMPPVALAKGGELRKKYPNFIYKGYTYALKNGDLELSFDFEVPTRPVSPTGKRVNKDSIRFKPKVVIKNIPAPNWLLSPAKQPQLDNLVFQLGLAEMPSYWKATASPNIIIEAGYLNKAHISWWHDLFIRGMGQYFYENKINFTAKNFLHITSTNKRFMKSAIADNIDKKNRKVLIPIGGGKDAVVTYEVLKDAGVDSQTFVLNPTKAQKALLQKMGEGNHRSSADNPIIVQRTIDPKLVELNREGFLNGHTPFSAYVAFLTTLCAELFEYKYIALSNERSSNEGNIQYLGHRINHQYSKTFEFEKKFRAYSKKYLTQHIEYFSFLRPLYELQIAKLFSGYPKYFKSFLSCNEAHKTNSGTAKTTGKWCGTCSKCLFVFTSLYPFVKTKHLTKVFGKNLFEDRNLIPLMEELVGEKGFKPFECIGTTQESLAAFYLSLKKTHPPLPSLLKHFRQYVVKKHPDLFLDSNTILASWDDHHAIPTHLEKRLHSMLK